MKDKETVGDETIEEGSDQTAEGSGDGAAMPPPARPDDEADAPKADTTAADNKTEKDNEAAKNKPKPSKSKEPQVKKTGAVRKAKRGIGYRAVKQRINNPHTGDLFTTTGTKKVAEIDNWLDAQVEAGVLIEVKLDE